MAWRVLVRFSLDGDKRSAIRNEIVEELTAIGMAKRGAKKTATWEASAVNRSDASNALSKVLDILARKKTAGRLDHIWVYIDKAT